MTPASGSATVRRCAARALLKASARRTRGWAARRKKGRPAKSQTPCGISVVFLLFFCCFSVVSLLSLCCLSASEPQVGIEPTTARLRIECSTTELLWRGAGCGSHDLPSAIRHLPSANRPSMPWLGFEPRRVAAPPPQDGVSTSFTTRAELQRNNRQTTEKKQRENRCFSPYDGSDGARTRGLLSDSQVL